MNNMWLAAKYHQNTIRHSIRNQQIFQQFSQKNAQILGDVVITGASLAFRNVSGGAPCQFQWRLRSADGRWCGGHLGKPRDGWRNGPGGETTTEAAWGWILVEVIEIVTDTTCSFCFWMFLAQLDAWLMIVICELVCANQLPKMRELYWWIKPVKVGFFRADRWDVGLTTRQKHNKHILRSSTRNFLHSPWSNHSVHDKSHSWVEMIHHLPLINNRLAIINHGEEKHQQDTFMNHIQYSSNCRTFRQSKKLSKLTNL